VRHFFLWAVLFSGLGCAHLSQSRLEHLRTEAEAFHHRIRWKDFQGASAFLIPSRQREFLQAREQHHDEKNLSISDYQLEEAQVLNDSTQAVLVSRMYWLRLPDLSEKSGLVTTHFVFKNQRWWVTQMEGGPFEELARPWQE
jgi:hypothetical protein